MSDVKIRIVRSGIIYRDMYSYSAHPHARLLSNGEILLIFNQTVRRTYILHPPEDPRYINFAIRSKDQGKTWSAPRVVPGFNWSGMECSGITVLEDEHIIINQWQFDWLNIEAARQNRGNQTIAFPADWIGEMTGSCELEDPEEIVANPDEVAPWARGSGRTYVHHSYDNGETWEKTIPIDTGSYSGGYGMRGAVLLDDKSILLPMSDVPNYQKVFGVRSFDGYTWEKPRLIASMDRGFFEEPCPFINEMGQIVVLLRENTSRSLFHVRSSDNGDTWTKPVPVGIDGYPADVARLADGRFIMVYGRRTSPLGIFAVVSEDGSAQSWSTENEIIIDDRFPNKNLGYPTIVALGNENFFVGYYGEDEDKTTCIWGTHFEIVS